MKIAFFGLPMAALALLADGHSIELACLSRKELPGTRRLRRLVNDVRVMPRVDAGFGLPRVDLIVSWFWTKKLPIEVVQQAPLGGFGVHPSLLPRWRGPDPYFWAVESGDETTGVTAHRLDAEYDTGAILGRRALAIDPQWNSWQLARALDRPSLALLRDTVRAFERDEVREEPQDESLVTLAPEPDDTLLEIDWNRDAPSIVRRIRAAAPYPGAWTFIGEEAVVVTAATAREKPRVLTTGQAAVIEGHAVVAAADGAVILRSGRRVDDDDREHPLDAAALAALVAAAQ
jgi:methionyl-tRNA formyltransferase